jgi:hypothetical protein
VAVGAPRKSTKFNGVFDLVSQLCSIGLCKRLGRKSGETIWRGNVFGVPRTRESNLACTDKKVICSIHSSDEPMTDLV